MSQANASSENGAKRAPSPTPSERSTRSDASTASSRIPKASGIKPPSATIKKPSTSASSPAPVPTTPRIGRLCTQHGHGVKPGPPPLELQKSKSFMQVPVNFRSFTLFQMEKRQTKQRAIAWAPNRRCVDYEKEANEQMEYREVLIWWATEPLGSD